MKTENVFRFVSVRGPVRAARDEDVFMSGDAVRDEVVKLLHGLAASERKSLDDARLKLGKSLLAGETYYRRDAAWRRLLSHAPAMANAVAEVRRNRSVGVFKQAVAQILTLAFGQEVGVDAFLDGAFKGMKATLWRSYFATVLAPYDRPEDRDETLWWLKVFDLLAATTDGARFGKLLDAYDRLRATVPLEFYRPAVRAADAAPPPPKLDDDRPGRVQSLKDRIARLEAAHDFVVRRMSLRRRQFRSLIIEENASRPAAPRRETGGGRPKAAAKKIIQSASSPPDLARKAPWRLSEDDFRESPDHLRTLEELGLHPEGLNGPALVTELEHRIALLHRDLTDLTYREGIITVANTFSRIVRGGTVPR